MTLLQEVASPLNSIPTSWMLLGISVVYTITLFLFSGEKSFVRDLFKSKERKAEEARKREDDQVLKNEQHIKTLESKVIMMQEQIDKQRDEILELKTTISKYQNNLRRYQDLFKLMEEYIKFSNPDEQYAKNFFEALGKIQTEG